MTVCEIAFRHWLSGRDAALDTFFDRDAPTVAMLDDPWTLVGLQAAVAAARDTFPDQRAVLAPENRATLDRFGRFVGEVFIRQFDGQWCDLPANAPAGAKCWPAVRCSGYLVCITPHSELELAIVEHRTKDFSATPDGILTHLFRTVEQRYRTWVAEQGSAWEPIELAG